MEIRVYCIFCLKVRKINFYENMVSNKLVFEYLK